MKWFFAFNEYASTWFGEMLQVAVVTAADHAPHLEPHCLYDGDGETGLTAWLRSRGVRIHPTRVAFRARLDAEDVRERNAGTGYSPQAARGFYLCLAVPASESAVSETHVLFTDCDVMFTGPVDLSAYRPSLLAAAPEMRDVRRPSPSEWGAGFNSGVMLMNAAAMRARMPAIEQVLERDGYYQFPQANAIYDQGALNSAIREGEWEPLPQTLNWRPAFGINPDAAIVHWHGPKPRHAQRTVDSGTTTAPDAVMRGLLDAAPEAYRHYLGIFNAALARA
ncbi:MAG: hypothetical protein AB7O28_23455 [Vicinamibacterales bacterium]